MKAIGKSRVKIIKKVIADDIRIELIDTLEALEPYADAWDLLALQREHPLPMLSHAWVSSYLKHQILSGESWFCLIALKDKELIGVLPVIASPGNPLGKGHIRLRTPSNEHTVSVDFLIKKGYEADIIRLFISQLRLHHQHFCHFHLNRIPESSPTIKLLHAKHSEIIVLSEPDGIGPYINVNKSYEEYCKHLGSKYERNLRRLNRKLEKLPDLTVKVLTDESPGDEYLKKFMSIEATGWKFKKGGTIIQNPELVSFYTELTRKLTRKGWLEWHFLESGDDVLACIMIIRFGMSLIVYKIAINEDYLPYSPGTILFEKMIERAFNSDEIKEIDCLSDYRWDLNWRMHHRKYYNIYVYNHELFSVMSEYVPMKIRKISRSIPGLKNIYHYFSDKIHHHKH